MQTILELHRTLAVTCCHSECCVPLGLDFEAAGVSVVNSIICFKGIESLNAHGKHA